MPVYHLDTSGLRCPLPVLRARKRLHQLCAGDRLVVEATDPAALLDFPAFCQATGHGLIATSQDQGRYRFEIEKVAKPDRATATFGLTGADFP